MLRRLMALALAPAMLAGCGGSDNATKAISDLPKCSSVWVVGKVLPKVYDGCKDDKGAIVAALTYKCKDGTELASNDQPKAFARIGQEIKASTDATYSAEFDACKGL